MQYKNNLCEKNIKNKGLKTTFKYTSNLDENKSNGNYYENKLEFKNNPK